MRIGMLRLFNFLTLVSACLLPCSCAYVPLSTMVKMYSFDERDFAELDPQLIKVRITVPPDFEVSIEDSLMDVRVEASGQSFGGEFKLTDQQRPGDGIAGLLGKQETKDSTIYTLRLSDESARQFARLQGALSGRTVERSKINISAVLKSAPCGAKEVIVHVDLSPRPAEGFIPIVDGARLQIDDGSSGRPCTPSAAR